MIFHRHLSFRGVGRTLSFEVAWCSWLLQKKNRGVAVGGLHHSAKTANSKFDPKMVVWWWFTMVRNKKSPKKQTQSLVKAIFLGSQGNPYKTTTLSWWNRRELVVKSLPKRYFCRSSCPRFSSPTVWWISVCPRWLANIPAAPLAFWRSHIVWKDEVLHQSCCWNVIFNLRVHVDGWFLNVVPHCHSTRASALRTSHIPRSNLRWKRTSHHKIQHQAAHGIWWYDDLT